MLEDGACRQINEEFYYTVVVKVKEIWRDGNRLTYNRIHGCLKDIGIHAFASYRPGLNNFGYIRDYISP